MGQRRWRETERKTHDRDNNGEAVRSRGYAQWQSARHCQSGVNCQLREEGRDQVAKGGRAWRHRRKPLAFDSLMFVDSIQLQFDELFRVVESNLCEKTRSIFNSSIFNSLRFLKQQYTSNFFHSKIEKVKNHVSSRFNHFPHFENNGEERRFLQRGREGRRKGADSWQEIPGDRKPGRCLWGPPRRRRRPLSVNGAESSPSRRGGDGCQKRISMTKGRWDAFSSLLLPRRGEGPPPLNSNAMGVCYANIPICC